MKQSRPRRTRSEVEACKRASHTKKYLDRRVDLKPYPCWVCGFGLRRADNLRRHLENKHELPKGIREQLVAEAEEKSQAKQKKDDGTSLITNLPTTTLTRPRLTEAGEECLAKPNKDDVTSPVTDSLKTTSTRRRRRNKTLELLQGYEQQIRFLKDNREKNNVVSNPEPISPPISLTPPSQGPPPTQLSSTESSESGQQISASSNKFQFVYSFGPTDPPEVNPDMSLILQLVLKGEGGTTQLVHIPIHRVHETY